MWLKGAKVYDSEKQSFAAGDLRIEEGRIAEIGRAPGRPAEAIDLEGRYLLPGFFDCHVHIGIDAMAPDPNNPWRDTLSGTIALHAADMAHRLLLCGVTTARDVGGWDYHEIAVREAIAAGKVPGARLFCAGRILTITSSTTPYYRGMYEEADGPMAVRAAARRQFAMGADFIKLLATGAITSTKYEKADAIQYRPDEIAEAVATAAANDTYVAAHAHALEGIRNAVECGCRSVEHGSFGDDAVYRLMAGRETWLVPTVCTTQAMMKSPAFAARVPSHIRARYESIHEIHVGNLRKAHRHGVKVAMGSDAGTPGNLCGDNLQEVEVMVNEVGFSPAEGIHAATLEAARLLRVEDRLGKIAEGYLADIVAVAENPLDDISALRRVEFVMKEGRVYKQGGRALAHPLI